VQIYEFSGEELKDVASEFWIPQIPRTHPDIRGRVEVQELGEAVTLSRTHWGGPISAVRTGRTAATASANNLLLFYVQMAGESRHCQHDRFAELTANSGVFKEARSPWKWVSPIDTRNLTLRFSRELLPLRSTEITEACARSMDPAAPAMQVLSDYLGRLFGAADDLTAPQRLDAGRAAIDLLAMALRDVVPSVPGGDGSAAGCST